MIIVRSHIGYGSPHKQDTNKAHGEALGEEEIRLTKKFYGWPEDAKFLVPETKSRQNFAAGVADRGTKLHKKPGKQKFKKYAEKYPELAAEWQADGRARIARGLGCRLFPRFRPMPKDLASRISSGKVLNAVAQQVPWLIGGAADLAPSTMTHLTFDRLGDFEPGNYGGRNFHFGIREHGMAAAAERHGAFQVRPYGATFFVFTDYMQAVDPVERDHADAGDLDFHARFDRPGRRRADASADRASGRLPGDSESDHDAPGDANEVAEAWRVMMPLKDRPVCLVLTRQNLPTLDRTKYAPAAAWPAAPTCWPMPPAASPT